MSNIAAPALLLTAFVLGCSPSAPTPSCAAGACRESERGYDAKSYELIGRFDWARQRLVATERVTIVRATTTTTTVELDAAVEVKHVRGMAREPGATADGEGPRSTAAQDPDHATARVRVA